MQHHLSCERAPLLGGDFNGRLFGFVATTKQTRSFSTDALPHLAKSSRIDFFLLFSSSGYMRASMEYSRLRAELFDITNNNSRGLPTSKESTEHNTQSTPPPHSFKSRHFSSSSQHKSHSAGRRLFSNKKKVQSGRSSPALKDRQRRPPHWLMIPKFSISTVPISTESDESDTSSSSSSSSDEDEEDLISFLAVSHSYSPSFSSPLTPKYHRRRPTPPRLLYPHRGLSRSGLVHVKEFWRLRYASWVFKQVWPQQDQESNDRAYSAIESLPSESRENPPSTTDVLAPLTRASESNCQSCPPESDVSHISKLTFSDPALTPRVGDLSALHNFHPDECNNPLAFLPSWTLSKLCWLFDATHREHYAKLSSYQTMASKIPESGLDNLSGTSVDDIHVPHVCQPSVSKESSISESLFSSTIIGSVSSISITPMSSIVNLQISDTTVPSRRASDIGPFPWETDWLIRWQVLKNALEMTNATGWHSNDADWPCLLASSISSECNLTGKRGLQDKLQDEVPRSLEQMEDEEDYGELLSQPSIAIGTGLNPYPIECNEVDSSSIQTLATGYDDYLSEYFGGGST